MFWLPQGTATVTVSAAPGQFVVADAMALWRARWGGGAMIALGQGTAGATGVGRLSLSGNAALAGTLRLQASSLAPATVGLWAIGFAPAASPLFGGSLLLAPSTTVFAPADAAGRAHYELGLPMSPGLRGVTLYAQCLALDAQATGRPGPLTGGPHPAQPLDQHGVVRERGRGVDQAVEHLVVPGRRHVEQLADRLLLGPGVLPPLALEVEDLAVPLGQLGVLGRDTCDVLGDSVHGFLLRDRTWPS